MSRTAYRLFLMLSVTLTALIAFQAAPALADEHGAAQDPSPTYLKTRERVESERSHHEVSDDNEGAPGHAHSASHAAATPANLSYHGGGVSDSAPVVVLDFWGWATNPFQQCDAQTPQVCVDESAAQAYLTAFFNGQKGGNSWLNSTTQYCGNVPVGFGANGEVCSSDLVGKVSQVFVFSGDTTTVPASPSSSAIAAAAQRAATLSGHGTGPNVLYVVATPHGHSQPGFGTQWCAYHSFAGSSTPYAYIPYMPDAGASCGKNSVNTTDDPFGHGFFDGFSIVAGHELAEALTDPFPTNFTGGWWDANGEENGDKCAWISLANINLAFTNYAVQPLWSNGTSSCVVSYTPPPPPGNDFSIAANPASVSIAQGGSGASTVSTAIVSGIAQTVSLSASGLPSGVTASFSPSSVTTGSSSTLTLTASSSATAGTATVTVTGTAPSGSHATSVSLTVTSTGGGGGAIVNGGFEAGSLAGWTSTGTTGVVGTGAHSGGFAGRAGGTNPTSGDSSLAQTFTAPTGSSTLSFWYKVTCPDTVRYDWATVTLRDTTSNTTRTVLARTCTNDGVWRQVTASITAGHHYTLTLTSHDDNYPGDPTFTLFDDVTVQ